ncbi:MAG TPA: PQQ-binding-like beta-propeller repeat protein [Acidimicrobiales bacterium]|nr:PQQ-binding-like beta-propeller repeat protein [Acidimicrobiales bacterium]
MPAALRSLPGVTALLAAGLLAGCGSGPPTATRPVSPGGTSAGGSATAPSVPGPSEVGAGPTVTGAPVTGDAPWPTYGGDGARTGLSRGAPPAGALRPAWTAHVDGAVYGEPLVADGAVLVATEHDTVTALDAATGAVRWSRHLATPVDGASLPCGDIDPSGITSTPAVDPATGTLWVVAFEQAAGGPAHHLVGLDVRTGALTSDRVVDPPGLSPTVEQQRGALLVAGGSVLVAYGGLDGDCGPYKGAVVAAPEAGGAPTAFVVPAAREGGIWSPPGPVAAAGGHVLVTTGNAASRSVYDDANAVLALTLPGPTVTGLYAPADWAQLSAADLDLSSTSPAVLADGRVVAAGKQGVAYLLAGGDLGGVGHQAAVATACAGSGAYGGMAVDGTTVVVPCRNGLRALTVGTGSLTPAWQLATPGPGTPLVAGGKVFDLARSGEVDEVDPATGAVTARATLPPAQTPFPALSGAGARIYAATGSVVTALTGA